MNDTWRTRVIAATWFVYLKFVLANRYVLNKSNQSGVYTDISRHVSSACENTA